MRCVGIITARAGSQGIERKNLAPFLGKPLLAHTVEAGQRARSIERLVVSTEDAEIKSVAMELGAEVIDRPKELATAAASSEDAVRHAVMALEAEDCRPQWIVLLQPTSPMRNSRHIDDCVDLCIREDAASAVSVTEDQHSPYKSFLIEDGKLKPLFDVRLASAPRQSLPNTYRPNGAIYVADRDRFLKESSFFVDPSIPYVMSLASSVDIDTIDDLKYAEYLFDAVCES